VIIFELDCSHALGIKRYTFFGDKTLYVSQLPGRKRTVVAESANENPILRELGGLALDLIPLFQQRDAAARLLAALPARYSPPDVSAPPGDRAWELSGLFFFNAGRFHEALGLFWGLYQRMLEAQDTVGRIHKGMPLVWISECFQRLLPTSRQALSDANPM
jgi:hypothetical protein